MQLQKPTETPADLPGVSVHSGFPNPAADSLRSTLDLNQLLIRHPAGTYFMRIKGNTWNDVGIFEGDIAIIDRVLDPLPNDLIVWWEGEQFMVSNLRRLPADTPQWGVVTAIIHRYRSRATP